jgi:hypothetical protein
MSCIFLFSVCTPIPLDAVLGAELCHGVLLNDADEPALRRLIHTAEAFSAQVLDELGECEPLRRVHVNMVPACVIQSIDVCRFAWGTSPILLHAHASQAREASATVDVSDSSWRSRSKAVAASLDPINSEMVVRWLAGVAQLIALLQGIYCYCYCHR